MIAVSILGTFLLVQARAEEIACDDPQSQAEMNRCAAQDFERADAELNRVWREVIVRQRLADRHIDLNHDRRPSGEDMLRQAQRAWVTFRDAHCTHEAADEARSGSMEPMIYNGCRTRITDERIGQLRHMNLPQ